MPLYTLSEFLVSEEGLELEPYKCPSGAKTIGVGHNIDANGLPSHIAEYLATHGSITKDHAYELLAMDIKIAESACCKIFGVSNFRMLSEPRKAVVISMAFQMGYSGLRKFITTIKLIKERRFEEASQAMLKSKWARQTPNRAKRAAFIMKENIWG